MKGDNQSDDSEQPQLFEFFFYRAKGIKKRKE